MRRVAAGAPLLAPAALVALVALVGAFSRARPRSTSSTRSSRSRSSSRSTSSSATPACSRSGTSASSPSAPGRRACSRCRSRRSRAMMPDLFPLLARPHGRQRAVARSSRPLVGRRRSRSSSGLPLMRLSGLAAGIATFAVLEITHNLLRYYEKIGPGRDAFSLGARDDRPAAGGDRRRRRDRRRRSRTR